MKTLWMVISAALTVCAVSSRGDAAPTTVSPRCLSEVPSRAVKVEASDGWVGFAPYSLQLVSATIAAGPPASFAELHGEILSRQRNAAATLYEFGGLAAEEGVWLVCSYGEAGQIELGRKLPGHLTRCTITHRQRVSGEPRRIEIECR